MKTVHIVFSVVMGASLGVVKAQEAEPPMLGDDSIANVMEPPLDLPGHARGEREKAEAPKGEETKPTEEEEREWFGHKDLWEWSRLTGDWGGARSKLESVGIGFAGSYTLDWSSVWSGGLRNVASTRSLLDLNLTLDLEKLAGLPGGSVFADFYSTDMRGGSRDAGDYQGVSNIETGDNLDQLAELWYQQRFFNDLLRLKLGKIDAAGEFAFVSHNEDNLHGGAGTILTIPGYPTYPDPAMGVVLFAYPTEWLYVGGGLFDGATLDGLATGRRGPATFFSDDKSDSWIWMGEVGVTWKELWSMGSGRLACGVWHHTHNFDRFDGGVESDATGCYALLEQQIIRRGEGDAANEHGLFAWLQYGQADEDIIDVAQHLGGGLVLKGTFTGREDDNVGTWLSWVDFSDDAGAGYAEDELAWEVFYKCQVTPWLSIRPDVQFIFNPSGDETIDDAVVGGLRFEISF